MLDPKTGKASESAIGCDPCGAMLDRECGEIGVGHVVDAAVAQEGLGNGPESVVHRVSPAQPSDRHATSNDAVPCWMLCPAGTVRYRDLGPAGCAIRPYCPVAGHWVTPGMLLPAGRLTP